MSDALETIEHKGYEIEIFHDENVDNPIKEWDMLGEYFCWHRKYDLGNSKRFDNPEELIAYARKTRSLLFSLYMYDHSGIGLSLSNDSYPFNCRWDSGQLGYILVDRKKVLKEYSKTRLSPKLKLLIKKVIEGEIETYNQYLSGDVYGYNITKDDEDIDSCWGYYGQEDVIEEAKGIVDYLVKEEVEVKV